MSINESVDESPPPSRQVHRQRTQQATQRSSKVPAGAGGVPGNRPRQPSDSLASYKVFKRDILYRAINEFQLSGSRLSAYTDLLTRLGFDLTPLVSQGQTWYLCRGKQDDHSPCRRMVPEVYLRTAVGKILRAADTANLKGDDLVEELATALSYAICAEHHRTIHKVARALDARKIVEQWREVRSTASGSTTPNRARSPNSPASRTPPTSPPPYSEAAPRTPPSKTTADVDVNVAAESGDEQEELDPAEAYGVSERLKVEKHYQEYLRASSRERRSNSDAGSSTSSRGAPPAEKMPGQRWRKLERNDSRTK